MTDAERRGPPPSTFSPSTVTGAASTGRPVRLWAEVAGSGDDRLPGPDERLVEHLDAS